LSNQKKGASPERETPSAPGRRRSRDTKRSVVVVDDAREGVRERGGVALRVRAFDAGADGGGDGDPRRYRSLAGQRRAL
jgi:hypothetical protein